MAIKSMPVKVLQCFLTKGTKKFHIKGYKNRNLALQMKHIRQSIYSIGHVRVSDVTSRRRNISSFESRSVWRLFSFLETRCMLFSHAASYSDTLRLPAFQYSYPLAELRCGSLGRRKFQVGDFCEIGSGGWWSRRFGRRWTRGRWHIGTGCRRTWKRHFCHFSCIGLDDHVRRRNPEVFITRSDKTNRWKFAYLKWSMYLKWPEEVNYRVIWTTEWFRWRTSNPVLYRLYLK